jgi:hypothetical protein
MTTSFSDSSVSAFVGGLTTLKTLVEKAAAHAEDKNIDPQVLLQARLFPDMFPFARQIYAATDSARRGVDRLVGKEPESAEQPETTFAALAEYLDTTIAYVESADRALIDASETREFTTPMGPKVTVDFTGRSYTTGFAFPNFLFHVVTAYNILRHNGIEVGKRDYLGPFIPR